MAFDAVRGMTVDEAAVAGSTVRNGRILEVGYKSTAQAMNDVLGGHIALFPVVVPLVLPHLKSGRVQALGVFDTGRSPLLPDVPPIAEELRVPGYVPTPVWYGFVAPAGTPREVVETLNGLVHGACSLPKSRTVWSDWAPSRSARPTSSSPRS